MDGLRFLAVVAISLAAGVGIDLGFSALFDSSVSLTQFSERSFLPRFAAFFISPAIVSLGISYAVDVGEHRDMRAMRITTFCFLVPIASFIFFVVLQCRFAMCYWL
ncbi:MAG: hypothetical protein JOZ13_13155 [Alphaproteobacteria bacterium]|nr:hypothetical protein [Alphaproteobacteria bacterium]